MNTKNNLKKPFLQLPKDKQDGNRIPNSNFSSSQQSQKAIDILRLLSKKQHSRQSKINYQQHRYNKKQQIVRHSDYPSNFRASNYSLSQQEDKYSTYAHKQPKFMQNINGIDESFLQSSQTNSIIGILLYLLFLIFISLEVIAISYVLPKASRSNLFYFQTALITILISQLTYYIILRYVSSLTSKRIFLYKSARTSFDKLMKVSKISQHHKTQQKTSWNRFYEKPYLLLLVIAGSVVICQLLYCKIATQVIAIFSKNEGYYMVSTLFWSNFGLPYLFNNFYLNRPLQDNNFNTKFFTFIVIIYMIQCLISAGLFCLLMIFNLILTYIHSKKQFDYLHINQLIKICMLIITIFYIIIKYYLYQNQNLFNQQVLYFVLNLIFHVILLTFSMLITRIIAIKYIKQELYRYFYTQTSINMAFILVAFLLNALYLDSYHRKLDSIRNSAIISIISLIFLAFIIYKDGRQRLYVVMNANTIQE